MKIAKTDVRHALRSILKEEMTKQQKADMEKMMEKQYEESYSDYCPYCNKIATVIGRDETTEHKEINGKKYLVNKCNNCGKELYVHIIMQPPQSMLSEPTFMGLFYTKEQIYKLPEEENKPKIKPKLIGGIFKG